MNSILNVELATPSSAVLRTGGSAGYVCVCLCCAARHTTTGICDPERSSELKMELNYLGGGEWGLEGEQG